MKRFYLAFAFILIFFSGSCNLLRSNYGEAEMPIGAINPDDKAEGEYYVLGQELVPDVYTCPNQDVAFITDLKIYQTPDLPKPDPRTPFLDPVFGTCMVRVTDRKHDILSLNDTSQGMKNEYARVQSFNADGSLLLVRSIESFWYIYDAGSLLALGEVPVDVEPRWHAQNPYLLYYTQETRLLAYDLTSGEIIQIHDFAKDFPQQDIAAVWTRYEGSPSYDSRFWGGMAQNSEWELLAFLIYDILEDTVMMREIPSRHSIDNVTISPLGNYFLASFDEYCEHDKLGSDANPCGLMVYDSNLQNGRGLLRIIGHYDAGLDAEGREVILYQDIDTDHISMLDLASGKITPLFSIDFSHTAIGFHFSIRASGLPGWGLVSTYNGGFPDDYTWMDDSIFAVELRANGRVVRLAHTHSRYDEDMQQDYWAEPHASVNKDFTKIIFTSNWGRTGSQEVDLYMIILPENWTEMLPD